jgi:predicted nuclease with TOPRIM domain
MTDTASLEQLATEVPDKLDLLVQELSAVQEGVDGLETYLDEMGDRATDLLTQVEAAQTLMDEVNETKTLFETGEQIVQELEPLVQDVVIAGNVAIALDQSVQELMA